MGNKANITTSINWTVGLLFVGQFVFYLAILFIYKINPTNAGFVAFVLSSAAIHIGLWIFLSLMHDHFSLVPTEEKLSRINIANRLTLFRISSIPSTTLLLILAQTYPVHLVLTVFVVVIFLTDLFDGSIARGNRQVTRIGKYLDSISDYGILFVISIAMVIYSIIPEWFFYIIIFRLLFQWIGMGALLIYQGYIVPHTTFLGKASIFATMTLYGLEILALANHMAKYIHPFLLALEYGTAFIISLSLVEKVFELKKGFIEAKETKKQRSRTDGQSAKNSHAK